MKSYFNNLRNAPIGMFDSGIGGLTVLTEIKTILPEENITYFGDIARTPYGSKSAEVVKRFAFEITQFLLCQNVKIVIIACNSASAVAAEALESEFNLPIIDVINPACEEAIRITKSGKVGIIGTEVTINSNIYPRKIYSLDDKIKVSSVTCPLFVPLVEEGWMDTEITRLVAQQYLKPMVEIGVDTLILGCTHYPLLKKVIQEVMGEGVVLIDSGMAVAKKVANTLESQSLLRESKEGGNFKFFVTDAPSSKLAVISKQLLNEDVQPISIPTFILQRFH